MIQIGEKSLSWTKFKDSYLLIINFAIVLSILSYLFRHDFLLLPFIGSWLLVVLVNLKFREFSKQFIKKLGAINSGLILTLFYFLFFTPFSIFYKAFFRNKAFLKSSSRFVKKDSISDFQYPF